MTAQTVLITGASSGIGYELAKLFARQQFRLVLVARSKDRLVQIKNELSSQQTEILLLPKDLASENAPLEIYNELKQKNIAIDILVNNAGFGLYGYFHELAIEKQLQMIQLNISAVVHLTHLFVQDMIARKQGKILNIASRAAFHAIPMLSLYAATKAAVLSFSEALASELKEFGDITVTAVCPGPVQTGFAQAANLNGSKMFTANAMSAAKVAQLSYNALFAGKRLEVPGLLNSLSTALVRFLPRKSLTDLSKLFIKK